MNGIILIADTDELIQDTSMLLTSTIAEARQKQHDFSNMNIVARATPDSILQLIRDPNAQPLPDCFLKTKRKMAVAFGPNSDALLARLAREMAKVGTQKKLAIPLQCFPMHEAIIDFCHEKGLKRLWIQPNLEIPEVDKTLTAQLQAAGLQTCSIDQELQLSINLRAIQIDLLYDTDPTAVKEEARRLWQSLEPSLTSSGAQAILLNTDSMALVDYEGTSPHCPYTIIDPHALYMERITAWALSCPT